MSIRNTCVLFVPVTAHQKTMVAYVDPTIRFALMTQTEPGKFEFETISVAEAIRLATNSDEVSRLIDADWVFEAGDADREGSYNERLFVKYDHALWYAQTLVNNGPIGEVYILPRTLY